MSINKQILNIDRYLAYCKHSKIPAKGTVYNAEDTTGSIFYIVTGTVVLMMEDRSGKEMIIDYLSAGSFFGSLGIYDEAATSRGERVVARVDCELGEMQYDRFLELVRISQFNEGARCPDCSQIKSLDTEDSGFGLFGCSGTGSEMFAGFVRVATSQAGRGRCANKGKSAGN